VTDLAEVIDSMPGELRDLAKRMKTQSISAIAREIGVPRTTLNDAVRRLRQRFEQAGLRDYL
jgi:transposase-like protein